MNLYEELKAAVPNPKEDLDTHYSDIYVLKTPKTEAIIKSYYEGMKIENQSSTFKDNISGRIFFDIPFGYMNEYIKERKKET